MTASPGSDAALLAEALRAQQAGRSTEAAALCRRVLAEQAEHPHASLLLGLIVGRDDPFAGAALVERYLAKFPDDPVALTNLGMLRQRQGNSAAALTMFERALALKPDLAAAWHGSALALHGLDRLDAASTAFESAFALGATDAVTYVNFGNLRRAQGRLDDALAAYDAAVAADPWLPAAHVSRGMALSRRGRAADAVLAFRQALALEPTSMDAHLGLAEAFEMLHLPDDARQERSRAYRNQPVTYEPVPDPVASVLLLCSADRRDVSVHFLLDPARFTKIHLILLRPQDGGPHGAAVLETLPRCDVVFNTISDADLGAPYFEEVSAIATRLGRPVLNAPERLHATRRDRLAETLAGIPHLVVPVTRRLSRAVLAGTSVDGAKLVRPVGDHGGEALERIEDQAALERYRMKSGAEHVYLSDFHDYRSADGLYRKYRLIFIDREPYPYHLVIGSEWKQHYWRVEKDVTDAMKREEAAFLADWRSVFAGPLADTARAIARRLDLDYGGMDCSLLPDGRIVLFEANANMLVHLNDSAERFPYKHQHVPRIFEAMAAFVQRRLG